MLNDKEYYAFISYSHKDEEWAKWLQHEFEHYHLPTTLNGVSNLPDKFRPIFRDVDELSGGELKPQISYALRSSAYLVIICSPNSAKSPYVNDEIREFVEIGKELGVDNVSNIFPFIVDGIPHSKENPRDECFPQALIDLPTELIAGDVTKHGREHAFVKILSGTLQKSGVSFGMLWNQFERDRIEAERKEREQRDNLFRTQSLFLAEKANALINNKDYDIANLIALEALPTNLEEPNRPYVREVEDALRKSAVYTSPIIRTDRLWRCIQTNGNIVVTEEGYYKIGIWDVQTGEQIELVDLNEGKNEYTKNVFDFDRWGDKWLQSIAVLDTNKIYLSIKDSVCIFDYTTKQLNLLNKYDQPSIKSNIIISPNKRYYIWLSEFSDNFYLSLYDCSSNTKLLRYSYTAPVSCSFSPNSKLLAFACHHDVHVYYIEELVSGKSNYLAKYRFYNVSLCTFIDDTHLLIVRTDKTIIQWNFLSKEEKIIYKRDEDILDIMHMENMLIIVTSSNNIIALDLRSGFILSNLNWSKPIKLLSFSNDGKLLYFRDNNSFRIWDFSIRNDGSRLLYYHQNSINCAAYSKDASCYVSVSDDSIKLWDVEKRRIIKSIALGINHYVYLVAASMIYKKIFIISNGFYCIDIDSGTIKLVYDESGLCEMNLSGDEKYISISGEDTIILFDTESLDIYKEIKLPQDHKLLWGKSIDFHPTEDLLVFAYTIEDDLESIHLCIWNYKIGASVVSVKLEVCSASEDMISFSGCGDYVIYEGWRGVYRWFYRTNILEKDDSVNPSSLQFSKRIIEPDGVFVVEKENLPLQQLMNQVRENLNDRQLTMEERQKYYLD